MRPGTIDYTFCRQNGQRANMIMASIWENGLCLWFEGTHSALKGNKSLHTHFGDPVL